MSTTTWDEMTLRERDRLMAETLGYAVRRYDHRLVPHYVLVGPDLSPVVAGDLGDGEQRTEAEAWEDAPAFTTDYNACRLVEDEIERRGRQVQASYVFALAELCFNEAPTWGVEHVARVMHAPLDQRCHAALRAMGVEI